MKIGIFGGTFDPIHYGHLIMASFVYESFCFDKIVFMPSGNPPHKTNKIITCEEIRAEMVKKSIEKDDRFEISLIEHGKNKINYTYDTMSDLISKNPDNDYYFLIGGDSLRMIKSWHEYKKLLKLIKFVVVDRVSKDKRSITQLVDKYQEISKGIYYLDMPIIELSSTEIRQRVKINQSIKYMVPEPVIEIIDKNGLYNE